MQGYNQTEVRTGLTTLKQKPQLQKFQTLPRLNPLEVTALQNAALHQQEKTRRELAELLGQVSNVFFQALNSKELLGLILKYLPKIIPHQRATVILYQDDELKVVAAGGFPREVNLAQLNGSLNESYLFQRVYFTQQVLMIPDVWRYSNQQQVAALPPARTWLGVPLLCADKCIGLLSLTQDVPGAYTDDQLKVALTFAKQAALALENTRRYEQQVRLIKQLEGIVYERTQALQTTYAQLEYLDETKTDFINIAAHELRTPLTVLKGYSQMMLQDTTIKKSQHLAELTESIHAGANRLYELINSMLDVAKIDSQTLKLYLKPLDLASLITQILQKFEKSLAERKLTVTVAGLTDLPTIEADGEALQKVFADLICNAIKYTPDGGKITIRGRELKNDQQQAGVEIVVGDTGIGIDPNYQELIFSKFYRADDLALHSTGKTKFKGAGPGLGLTIAHGLIKMHRGQIWVESPGRDENICPGSQFHIVLPLHHQLNDG